MATRLPHSDIDPPKEYADPIGELVLRWSRLEYQIGVINRVISKAGKEDQRRLIINQRTSSLCRTLRLLAAGVTSGGLLTALITFADDVEKECGRRDDYVHSVYGYWVNDPGTPMRFRLRKGMPAQPVSAQEIADVSAEIRNLQWRAQDLTTRLKANFGTRL